MVSKGAPVMSFQQIAFLSVARIVVVFVRTCFRRAHAFFPGRLASGELSPPLWRRIAACKWLASHAPFCLHRRSLAHASVATFWSRFAWHITSAHNRCYGPFLQKVYARGLSRLFQIEITFLAVFYSIFQTGFRGVWSWCQLKSRCTDDSRINGILSGEESFHGIYKHG